MRVSVYLPLLLSLVLAVGAPLLGWYLAPALAARALTIAAAISAAASTWGLTLLALTLLTHTPPAEERAPSLLNPVPDVVATLAAITVFGGLARGVQVVRTRRRIDREMRTICALCQPRGELAVFTDANPQAYAVPGWPGRILVSTGLLRVSDATDRRIVLAHERAHLRYHHNRYRGVAELAAALNPILIPARHAVSYLVERWADEEAAASVGSRTRTAHTLASIALAAAPPPATTALGFHKHSVYQRVRALQQPPRSIGILAAAMTMPAGLAAIAAADATLAFTRLLTQIIGA